MKNENQMQPAYPPQVLLDQFQRPVAPFPGFTKLEAAALAVLPYFLDLAERKNNGTDGILCHPLRDAFYVAEEFCKMADDKHKAAQGTNLTPIQDV